MSVQTLSAGDFDDFASFLEFAAIVSGFDRNDLPAPDFDGHRRPRRPARCNAKRAAIAESLGDK
jgi:hypothetical protein